jgi:hypothetical protein
MGTKNIVAPGLAFLLLACGIGPVSASSGQGTTAFQFLQLGVGARPSGMGETFAGLADDVNAVYWNPAGLAGIERPELSMTHALWLEDITYSNVVYARPALRGTIGAAFNVLNTGSIQEADNTGSRLSENFSMSDMVGLVSYARAYDRLSLGANLKFISSSLQSEHARSYAADFGVLYKGLRFLGRDAAAGLSLQNIGPKAKYVSEEYPLPFIVRAGASLRLSKGLLAAADLNYVEKATDLHAGAEYTRNMGAAALAVRLGYKSDTVKELGGLSALTAGLGINWKDFQLDYAWNSFTDLGVTQRISIGFKFAAQAEEEGAVTVKPQPIVNPEPAPEPRATEQPVPETVVQPAPEVTEQSAPEAAEQPAPSAGDGL